MLAAQALDKLFCSRWCPKLEKRMLALKRHNKHEREIPTALRASDYVEAPQPLQNALSILLALQV
jgi:hypothetical protein